MPICRAYIYTGPMYSCIYYVHAYTCDQLVKILNIYSHSLITKHREIKVLLMCRRDGYLSTPSSPIAIASPSFRCPVLNCESGFARTPAKGTCDRRYRAAREECGYWEYKMISTSHTLEHDRHEFRTSINIRIPPPTHTHIPPRKDGGYLFCLEARGYMQAGPWTPEVVVEVCVVQGVVVVFAMNK